ncbi:S-layer homology domain-containing protein [Paenibacillus sp. cl141a]|uniref:S-layer homology domain-containing protein n=1 Tax=Paenibacillus sp. cl141a TaxID=1761877 RepID=UPI0008C3694A|nr:S-layer homology domain-containing protein [Paenibacillus sp. cl141a]SEL20782.1 S-layer homology domain-containing protein [Paenibacillus sp. cl141a]
MKHKLIVKVMTTAALLSACAFPAHAAPASLTDISNSYAKDAILELVDKGIINGKGNGTFDPTGKIYRQDFAIILAKALSLDVTSAPPSPTFSDIPATHYSYTFVEAAVKAGLIKGQGNGEFGLGENLSRQDMAVLFIRALGIDASGKAAELGNLNFRDAASISNYAKDAVAAAVELKLLSGLTDGSFNPAGSADRQSVALVASRFLKAKDELPQIPDTTTEPGNPTPPPATEKPVPPPSTNNNSGGGGATAPSNPGTPSESDTIPPTVTMVSTSPVMADLHVIVRSTESGIVYLVPASKTATTKAQLESLVAEKLANKAIVASANAETAITTTHLALGDYKVYAVDSSGNVSAATSTIVLQARVMEQPTLYFSDQRTLVFAYNENLNPQFVPGVEDFSVYTEDGTLKFPKAIEHVRIIENKVEIVLAETLQLGRSIKAAFNPLDSGASVRSLTGKISPVVGPASVTYLPDNVKEMLDDLIAEANALMESAEIGNTLGKYPQEAVESLNGVIQLALSAAENPDATPQTLAEGYNSLSSFMGVFRNLQVKPLTISLAQDASFVLNTKTQGSPTVVSDYTSMDDTYNKRSIKKLIQIKRDGSNAQIEYQYNQGKPEMSILQDYEVIGHIEIESSDPSLVLVSGESQNGITVKPIFGAQENSTASLRFKVIESGKETGSVELPVTFDFTPPTVTQATYDSSQGTFTLMSNELVYSYYETVPLSILVDYSGNNDFSSNSSDIFPLILGEDFMYNIMNDRSGISISLTPKGIAKLSTQLPGGAFRLTINGMSDFAMNWQMRIEYVPAR